MSKDSVIVAKLVIEVEYEELPEYDSIEEAVERLNELGAVIRATLTTTRPVIKEFS